MNRLETGLVCMGAKECPKCGKNTLRFESANMSRCETCGERVANVEVGE